MGSTDASERSLSSGLLPQWMKNRITDARLDLDEPAAFSPPTLDDSFFYIRYPREDVRSAEIKDRDIGYRPITQILNDKHSSFSPKSSQKIDFSKHTPPCQQFIANAGARKDYQTPKPSTSNPIKIKSNGTDDGFKGEGAACGTSIIQVANQMVSGNQSISRNITVTTLDKQFSVPENQGFDPIRRRGSKSLPASPLTSPITSPNSSPKLKKKGQNRYFTGVFTDKYADTKDLYHGSWILSGLLGQRDVLSKSNTTIAEEESEKDILSGKIKWQTVEVNNINMDEPQTPAPKENKPKSPQLFRPKPSELREMNFWSPTSMQSPGSNMYF